MPTTFGARTVKRFTRPDAPPRYRQTPRDVHLLEALARFRDLSVDQLARWDGGSLRGVRARLYRLWADNLVERPAQQGAILASHYHHGPAPTIYRLSRKGAQWLETHGFDLSGRLDWTFRTGTTPALAHNLAVADVMIGFHLATARHDHLELCDHHELIPHFSEATRASRRPFALAVTLKERGKTTRLTNVPDRLCAIRCAGEQLPLALELDTGSEVLDPRRPTTKPSLRRKLTVYYQSFVQERYRALWGFERLRVLFVVPSETRIKNILALQREITAGTDGKPRAGGMFLYSTPARLAAHGPLGPAWISSDADGVSLLPAFFLATQEPR